MLDIGHRCGRNIWSPRSSRALDPSPDGNGQSRWEGLSYISFPAIFLLIAVFSGLPYCNGQTFTATLLGTVTDQTGSVVPGATVTATHIATGISTRTASDVTGNYVLPALQPGIYSITVEKSGFKTTVISGIQLLVNQHARINAQLQVGQLATTVEVSGATPLVDTATASVGTVIEQQEVVDLPLNLRRPTALATLVPGTISASSFGYAANVVGGSPFSEDTYVANGTRDASNTLLIDDMESRAWSTGGFALEPPPDAVQEFKIQTNTYSAAFGKTAGSTMNLVTKSGTNQFHGDLYEFLRNDKFDSRNFFAANEVNPVTNQEIPGTARPEFRRNQFGGTLGGPIQKDKTFLFVFFDGLRQIQGLTLGNFVPTAAEKAGDFSSVLTGQTANLCGAGGPANLNFDTGQLFNPATETLLTCPPGSAKSGSTILTGTPLPGNIVTQINPVAQKVLASFPLPNRPGFPNYINQNPLDRSDNQFGVRLDHTFGATDQVFGRYLFAQSQITNPAGGYSTLPGFGDTTYFRGQNVILEWTHSFGGHLLNVARMGFQRNNPVENCQQCPRAPGFIGSFGVKNMKSLGPALEGYPFFTFNNFTGVGDAGYRPVTNVEMVENPGDSLTWTRGRHTIVIGADMQWWQDLRQQNPYSPHGQFTLNGQFSSLAGEIPNAGSVSDLADLLLGYPSFAGDTLSYADANQVGGTFWSWYGQDDIKVNQNLSLNLGLRYEYRRPMVDKSNNIVSFMPLGAPFSGPGNAALLTALPNAENDALCSEPSHKNLVTADGRCLVLGSAERAKLGFDGRTQRTLVFPVYDDFAPRFGLTWRPWSSDKFILRTGYGIFYDLGNLNMMQFVTGNPIFGPNQIYNTAFGSPPPLTNGFPTTTENVFAASPVPLLSQQYAALFVEPNFQPPRVQEWSFGIESQWSGNWASDISYIGNIADHLDNTHIFANQPLPGVGPLQSRRPYPDFNVLAYFTSDANSNYNALQAKLTRRFSSGLFFLTSYTWGKTLGNEGGNEEFQYPQYDGDLRANY